MNFRQWLLGGLSYGAALLAGCLAVRMLVPEDGAKSWISAGLSDGACAADSRKVSQRPGAGSMAVTGEASTPVPTTAEDEWRAKDELVAAALRELETLGDPGDLSAALEAEVAKIGARAAETSPRCVALVYLWMKKDPAEFGVWLTRQGEKGDAGIELLWALKTTVGPAVAVMQARQGEEAVVEISRTAPAFFTEEVLDPWVKQLLRQPDPERLTRVEGRLGTELGRLFTGKLGSAWPVESRDLKVRWAAEQGNVEMMTGGLRSGPGDGRWLRAVLEDATLPEAFRAELGQSRQVANVISQDPEVPMEARVAAFKKAAEGEERLPGMKTDEEFVAWLDVQKEFQRVDWPYLLAAAAPELLRRQIFEKLAEADPARAAELLEGEMPAAVRADWYAGVVRHLDGPAGQRVFQEILKQVPDDEASLRPERDLILRRQAGMGLNQQAESYLSAVEGLPAGPDRDVLLAKLVWILSDKSPAESERLRAQIGDGTLRAQGWNPPDEWEVGP